MADKREGHTSLVKELKRDQKEKAGVVVLSVGGKGLLNAMVEGLRRAGWADVPVVAMETEGAHSLKAAMNAGRLVTLPAVTRVSSAQTKQLVEEHTVFSEASDQEAVKVVERF
ncbi:L-serine dehydratase/L-threonine deaminase isoform X2 [Nothobranchius furzeri]